jgi:hypothetical protein
MKTLILILLPFFAISQDTLPAIVKLEKGNHVKRVAGKVILTKDCEVLGYLRINTWRRKEQLRKFKGRYKAVDHRLFPGN